MGETNPRNDMLYAKCTHAYNHRHIIGLLIGGMLYGVLNGNAFHRTRMEGLHCTGVLIILILKL